MNFKIATGLASFGSSARRHIQVIISLFRREEEIRRATPTAAVVNLLEPISVIAGIGLVYWLLERHAAPLGGSPAVFYGSGLYIKYYFLQMSQRMKFGGIARRFPIETWMDQLIVNAVLKFIDYILLGIAMVVILAVFIDPNAVPSNFIPIFESMMFMTMLAFGWGILVTVISRLFAFTRFLFSFVNRMLILLSGALFVVDFLPLGARYWMSFIPTTHAVILFRQGFYPDYRSIVLDIPYLFYCSVAAVICGVVLEQAMRRKVEAS